MSMAEATASSVIRMINENHYVDGDRLPPERDLAALLGVSRTTVREASSRFRHGGISVPFREAAIMSAESAAGRRSNFWMSAAFSNAKRHGRRPNAAQKMASK